MKEINRIEGKAPEVAAQDSPFEIVIRTKDPEYIAHGGPVEQVIPCNGYILCTTHEDRTQADAQGEINQYQVVRSIAQHIDSKKLFLMAALGALDAMKDTDE
jgi:hypothetical protein